MVLIYERQSVRRPSHHPHRGERYSLSSLRVVKYPMLRDPPKTRMCIGVVGGLVGRVWWGEDKEAASKLDVS